MKITDGTEIRTMETLKIERENTEGTEKKPLRIIRLPEVKERIGLSRSSIYLRIDNGEFPKPISLGGRSVGWVEYEIDEWIEERILAKNSE